MFFLIPKEITADDAVVAIGGLLEECEERFDLSTQQIRLIAVPEDLENRIVLHAQSVALAYYSEPVKNSTPFLGARFFLFAIPVIASRLLNRLSENRECWGTDAEEQEVMEGCFALCIV